MAWKGKDKTPGKFNDLLAVLQDAKLQHSNPPLYQLLSQIIQRSNDGERDIQISVKEVVGAISEIGDTIIRITSDAQALSQIQFILNEPVPTDPATNPLILPNALQILEGIGITFTYPNPNEIVINADATGDGILPMVNGDEPPQLLSNGVGDLILIPYSSPI